MKVDIAIMTVREDEFTAVRRYFQTERRRIPNGRTFLIGEVKTKKQTYTIAIARCSEQGNDASQRLAHYIIHNLEPQLILVVGIAGGVPHDEFTLGDVIVSTRIVNPNVDAWHPDGTTDYTTRGGPPHPLVENIVSLLPGEPQLVGWANTIQLERPGLDPEQVNITGDEEWRKKVRESLNWHFGEPQNRARAPIFTIGHILSSNHLMKDPARLREILKAHRSILAVEMEVAGVYEAAQGIDHQYPVMAIRGISDIVGLQRDRRWTEYACQAAAAFMYAFIMSDPLDPPLNSASFQKPIVPSEISSAPPRVSEPSLDTQHSAWHRISIKTTIFVSHTKEDADCAEHIRRDLEARGYTTWREPTALTLESILYPRTIENVILGSAAVVLVWSSNAARSEWVERQILFAQQLKKPLVPVVIDSAGFPPTLIVSTIIISHTPCTDAAAQLLPHLPPPASANPLMVISEKAAHEFIRIRKEAIDQAAEMLKRGEQREAVLALLEYLAHNDLMIGVREKAQEALDADANQVRAPAFRPEDSRHIIGVRCKNGHITYFDKRRICSDEETVVRSVQRAGLELDERDLTCGECGAAVKVHVDCRGYR